MPPRSRSWESLTPGYRAFLERRGTTRAKWERGVPTARSSRSQVARFQAIEGRRAFTPRESQALDLWRERAAPKWIREAGIPADTAIHLVGHGHPSTWRDVGTDFDKDGNGYITIEHKNGKIDEPIALTQAQWRVAWAYISDLNRYVRGVDFIEHVDGTN
jgi:hypothetical protein